MVPSKADTYEVIKDTAPSLPNGRNTNAFPIPGLLGAVRQSLTPARNPIGNSASIAPRRSQVGDIPAIARLVRGTQVRNMAGARRGRRRSKLGREGEVREKKERKGKYYTGHPVHEWPGEPTMEPGQRPGQERGDVGGWSGATGGEGWRPIWEEGKGMKGKEEGKEGKRSYRKGPMNGPGTV